MKVRRTRSSCTGGPALSPRPRLFRDRLLQQGARPGPDTARFDSLHALQIVLEIEQHYDIEVEDRIVFETSTVREFAAAIAKVIAETGAEPLS
ncbi:acyl carrier protein [Streptomyces sp. NPDC006739]|uniref:acyl carrier protein n=1 Tax=Streptomyces sp. NPDC006739 TaxID=3364763 RepID=UPI0036C2234D